ncbi:hypothetical protein GCM10009559_53140 [Pseudonocardia zijingensis]|uniref:HdeD family acid-resistance protein n=1 Tax=Pseudonocardia zijingensis TaxID=153376 RepID=A0ABN1N738_9PSEU
MNQTEEAAVSGPHTSPASASAAPPGAAESAPPVEPVGAHPEQRPIPAWRRVGLVVFGLLTVVYGLLVMSLRPAALATVAILAGFALIVGGVAQLGLAPEVERGWRWLAYLGGVVGIIAGLAAFFWPALTLFVLALVTAWSLVINGVIRIIDSVVARTRDLWWLGLIAGVLELGLGLWAIGSPGRELLLLVNLIGIYLIIAGVDAIVAALTAERDGGRAQAGAVPAQ